MLDVTFIQVDPAKVDSRIRFFDAAKSVEPGPHWIPQHPGGRDVALALGSVVRVGKNCVYYKIWTEEGSSGSPVLDSRLEVVAVHSRGKEEQEENGGSNISAVLEFIKQFEASPKRGCATWKADEALDLAGGPRLLHLGGRISLRTGAGASAFSL
jgi:hypothetical protein